MKRSSADGTWVDVGTCRGETTLSHALHNPNLKVFAFEPNLRLAAKLISRASNYLVIPMAVAEQDGTATFYVNEFEMAGSLLQLNEDALRTWVGVQNHKVQRAVTVPTIRLDTFMDLAGLERIDFLKIDAQGMDLSVARSAGRRLCDIARITVEVAVASVPLYKGAPSKDEVLKFFEDAGFALARTESQTHGQEENLTFIRS
jgi:FkbM family methyltransferase